MIVRIRELILGGALPPGARVTEVGIAAMLGVSRTPVRNVLPVLAKEGLLDQVGSRGFRVRSFSLDESLTAIELRSAIEGLAARVVARDGATDALRVLLADCLSAGDAIFAKRHLTADDAPLYAAMNARFHSAIVEAAADRMVADVYSRVNLVPFAAPAALAFDPAGPDRSFDLLFYAHRQHHAITEAILAGDGARADLLFREHSNQQRESLRTGEVGRALKSRRKKRRIAIGSE